MTNHLRTIERLRPKPSSLDTAWSSATLNRILAPAAPRKRRRTRWIATGAAGLVLVTAGGAYAAGLVPEFVSRGFGQVSTSNVTDQQLVTDLRLPDGRRVAVWTGHDQAGDRCRAIADDWDGRNTSEASSFECRSRIPAVDYLWTSASYRNGDTPSPAYLVVFGVRPDPTATTVRITGPDFDITTPVDATSDGFGTNIPVPPRPDDQADTPTPVMHIDFLNAKGTVVAAKVLQDS